MPTQKGTQLNTGRTHFGKGHIPWNKGKVGVQKHSEETRRKISKMHKSSGVGKWMIGRVLSEETKKR